MNYKAMKSKLKMDEEDIQIFFDTVLDLLCIAGFDGYFKRLSPTWTITLGWSIEELMSRPFVSFVHPDDLENTIQITEQLSLGERVIGFENRFRCKDGSFKWIQWNSYGLVERKMIIAAARDISAQKEMEQFLIHAKEEAERANKAKSEFLANISHEIRTPLNAVIGFSDLLYEIMDHPKERTYVEAIQTAGKSLLTLINDLLDLSKLEAGMMDIKLEPVNIRRLFGEIKQIFQQDLMAKNLECLIEVDGAISGDLLLDETRLRQVLLNLMGNAVKFTDHGSVKMVATLIAGQGKTIDLDVAIEDTGIGIDEKEHDIIFESFRQRSGQDNRKYEGTGLGLSITKRLVEIMHGHITLRSTLGVGSRFVVHLKNIGFVELDGDAQQMGPCNGGDDPTASHDTFKWIKLPMETIHFLESDIQPVLKRLLIAIRTADVKKLISMMENSRYINEIPDVIRIKSDLKIASENHDVLKIKRILTEFERYLEQWIKLEVRG